jgi:hypothetical protein
MRPLAPLRSRHGRWLAALLLLATFVAGSAVAAWHVALADGPQAEAWVADGSTRAPATDHRDQTCRVCGAVVGSLLPLPAPVLAVAVGEVPRGAGPAGAAFLPDPRFAGPLGSRAPPARVGLI